MAARAPSDDRPIWNVILGIVGLPAVLLAHRLRLFPLLAERPRTTTEVSDALGVASRPAAALLAVNVSLGLIAADGERFALTPAAEDYLLESSETYCGAFLDVAIMANPALYSWETLQRAVLTNSAQTYGGEDLFDSNERQAELARRFTQAMHGHSMGPAQVWPGLVDLASHRVLLDVGGGSGAHTVGAMRRWPHLRGILFDMPSVAALQPEFLARHGVQDRVEIHAGDMFKNDFPDADVHLYADVFHDWPPEQCRELAAKSCARLPPGGRIVVHEMLFADDKQGPFAAAAYNVAMLLWTRGQQFSGRELTTLLRDVGFNDVAVVPSLGYWSVVTAVKPS